MNYILLITGIMVMIIIDIREVLRASQRVRVMAVYFTLIIGSSLISFLLVMDRAPVSPAVIIKGIIEGIKGWIK